MFVFHLVKILFHLCIWTENCRKVVQLFRKTFETNTLWTNLLYSVAKRRRYIQGPVSQASSAYMQITNGSQIIYSWLLKCVKMNVRRNDPMLQITDCLLVKMTINLCHQNYLKYAIGTNKFTHSDFKTKKNVVVVALNPPSFHCRSLCI